MQSNVSDTKRVRWCKVSPLGAFRKIAKSDYYLRHVRPSVRMKLLNSHWMDFDKIWFKSFFENTPKNSSLIKIRQE
jgi:hypothetical protein